MVNADPPTAHTLDVPGARLHYQVRGSGPVLLLIGVPMDSTGFAGLAPLLADSYTVVTYDSRGITRSTCADPHQDVTPEILADDAHRLLTTLDAAPASVFGSSGGAITGLALVTRHPEQVHTLIAHEPPLIELLPDRTRHRAAIEDIYGTYRSDGPEAAMGRYFTVTGIPRPTPRGAPDPATPAPAPMHNNLDMFLGHMLRPITRYRPDLPALHTASTHIVVASGATSPGQLPHRTALALAEQLDTGLVTFPGGHAGFAEEPQPFQRTLRRLLAETSR